MDDKLKGLEEQVQGRRDFNAPPLHLWHPPRSGDIPIVIKADGRWYHAGGLIKRDSLMRLFASILRREEDGEYYLVTPVEKWRIVVELHPLLVTDVQSTVESGGQVLMATLNTGQSVTIDTDHPLFLEPSVGDIAVLQLNHGLTALFSRAAWYRLVAMAEDAQVRSAGEVFSLLAAR